MNAPSVLFQPPTIPSSVLLQDAESIRQAITAYLHRTLPHGTEQLSDNHPTPEGLALACGFAGYRSLLTAIENLPEPESPDDVLPATTYLSAAFATLQDYYLKHALSSRVSAQIVKFLSSAYFDIREKTESTSTTSHTENRTITVRVVSTEPATPEEAREMKRLREALAEQTRNELVAMNRTERRSLPASPQPAEVLDVNDLL